MNATKHANAAQARKCAVRAGHEVTIRHCDCDQEPIRKSLPRGKYDLSIIQTAARAVVDKEIDSSSLVVSLRLDEALNASRWSSRQLDD